MIWEERQIKGSSYPPFGGLNRDRMKAGGVGEGGREVCIVKRSWASSSPSSSQFINPVITVATQGNQPSPHKAICCREKACHESHASHFGGVVSSEALLFPKPTAAAGSRL